VEQLEILRILGEAPTREWSHEEIVGHVQVSPEAAQSHLQALEKSGLLRCRRTPDGTYCQYGPHTQELENKVRRLLEVYQQRPVTMIRLVYERPAASLRDFADSFRLRKKE
jgi:DNA-binding IclR family transcriptional regulator